MTYDFLLIAIPVAILLPGFIIINYEKICDVCSYIDDKITYLTFSCRRSLRVWFLCKEVEDRPEKKKLDFLKYMVKKQEKKCDALLATVAETSKKFTKRVKKKEVKF